MIYIGVLFHTDEMTLRVTEEKLHEILELISLWLQKKAATLQELQSLVGKLNFICPCVHATKVFIARVLKQLLRQDILVFKGFFGHSDQVV